MNTDYQINEPFSTNDFNNEQGNAEKCFYCNKNINANCHAHKDLRCKYSCNYNPSNPISVGDGFSTILLLVFVYVLIKKIKK